MFERINTFNDNVRMTLNLTNVIKLLGCSKVVGLRVDKESSFHILNIHLNGEWVVFSNGDKILWEDEFG